MNQVKKTINYFLTGFGFLTSHHDFIDSLQKKTKVKILLKFRNRHNFDVLE